MYVKLVDGSIAFQTRTDEICETLRGLSGVANQRGDQVHDELTERICRFGGPLVLFICSPLMAWLFWKAAEIDLIAGKSLPNGYEMKTTAVVLVTVVFGLWMCRKGYGWFDSGRNKNK
jgi:hypothetical protein